LKDTQHEVERGENWRREADRQEKTKRKEKEMMMG